MPVNLSAEQDKTSAPAWFFIGDLPPGEYASIEDVIEARKSMMVKADTRYLKPQNSDMESLMNGQDNVWVVSSSMLQNLQPVSLPLPSYVEMFSPPESGNSFAGGALELFRQWNASSFSFTNVMATVNNIRHLGITLISSCLFEFILLLLAGSILMNQLLTLLFESQKQDLVHLFKCGLPAGRAASLLCRMFSLSILLIGTAGMILSLLNFRPADGVSLEKAAGIMAGAWILFILVYLISGAGKIRRLFSDLLHRSSDN